MMLKWSFCKGGKLGDRKISGNEGNKMSKPQPHMAGVVG